MTVPYNILNKYSNKCRTELSANCLIYASSFNRNMYCKKNRTRDIRQRLTHVYIQEQLLDSGGADWNVCLLAIWW